MGFVKRRPDEKLRVGTKFYEDIGKGDWNGFYDWLRDENKKVIGIRYWPYRERKFIIEAIHGYPYVETEAEKCSKIFFSSARVFVEELSADQEFGNDFNFSQ